MPRTISVSGVPKRLFRYLAAGFAVFVGLSLAGQALWLGLRVAGVSAVVPDGSVVVVLLAALWLGLTVLWVRRMRGWETSDSMWDPIPPEQYLGRFAEAGGIARHNWEKAVERLPGGDDEN